MSFDLVWEVPLGSLSFGFYRAVRVVLGAVARAGLRARPDEASGWKVWSAEMFARPLMLPFAMTTGPRWNCHVLGARLGPLDVASRIEIDTSAADLSARTWSFGVYASPGWRTVATRGSGSGGGPRATFEVPPGRYLVSARYYHWSRERVRLPAVEVDGRPVAASTEVSPDVNDFYRDLASRRNAFYLGLHYHVVPMLRLRRFLPRAFVERQFLPVGNPETAFRYGPIRAGEKLRLEVDPELAALADVYWTLYDRASFPIQWGELALPCEVVGPAERNGFYLVRVHPRSGEVRAHAERGLVDRVEV